MKFLSLNVLFFPFFLNSGAAFLAGRPIPASFLQKKKKYHRNQIMKNRNDSQLNYITAGSCYDGNQTGCFFLPDEEDACSLPSSLVQIPLDYDQDIQTKIDVSKPYYALQNEFILLDDKSHEVKGFACSVLPEMPHGREGGSITAAEAGRHMAIAGSIASAMVQPKDGKFYYLALDAKLSRKPFTGIADDAVIRDGNASILAKCVDMGGSKPRSCSSEIIMEVTPDEDAWFLQVSYCMIPERLFRKMYGEADDDSISRMQEAVSPYTNFSGLPNAVRPITGTRTDTTISCYTTLPPPRPEDCLGHFDKKPALPIAYTCSFFSDLIAQTIFEISGVPTAFRTRDKEEVKNCNTAAAAIVCQEWNIKAEELVFANSFGQHVRCDVEMLSFDDEYESSSSTTGNGIGKFFRASIRAFKENGSGKVIFTSESVWEIVSEKDSKA